MARWFANRVLPLAVLAAAAPVCAPQLLAFPYHAQLGASEVWSESPLPRAALDRVLSRANALVAASPLAQIPEGRHIFLTQGGWRWRVLALSSAGGFGLTRAVNEAVIINHSNLGEDAAFNGAAIGGRRSLTGVIAHEVCHGMERRRFGLLTTAAKPAWLTEGYCDFVARESSLTAADVAALKAQGKNHPALVYYEGRRRVAAELARNGGNVDALFAAE